MPSDSKKKRNAKKGSATSATNGTGAASNGTANGASNKLELSEEGKLLFFSCVSF